MNRVSTRAPALGAMTVALVLCWACPAAAEDQQTAEVIPPLPFPGGNPMQASEGCSQYDSLVSRVNSTRLLPSPCLSLSPEAFGLRKALADKGIGFSILNATSYSYDLLGHNAKPQTYGGQNPTWANFFTLNASYDLSRIGFSSGSQFQFGATWGQSTYRTAYPNQTSITAIAVQQPLFDGAVELRYGLMPLLLNFYGMNLASLGFGAASGPISIVPYEIGLGLAEPQPSFQVTLRDPNTKKFYSSFAVARSSTPQDEVGNNPYGLRLAPSGTRPLVVEEFGYGSPTGSTWARVGGIYNWTHFDSFTPGAQTHGNYAFYAGLTQQLTDIGNPMHGLFVDVKADYSPSDRNLYAKDFLISFYYKGPFPSRPVDMISIGYGISAFSRDLRNTLIKKSEMFGQGTPDLPKNTQSVTLSYAALLMRGVFAISTLSYTTAPAGVAAVEPKKALTFTQQISFSF